LDTVAPVFNLKEHEKNEEKAIAVETSEQRVQRER